jgi:hypothetical protein
MEEGEDGERVETQGDAPHAGISLRLGNVCKHGNFGFPHRQSLTNHNPLFFAQSSDNCDPDSLPSSNNTQLLRWASQQQWPFPTAPRPSQSQSACGLSPYVRQHNSQSRTTHPFFSGMDLWWECRLPSSRKKACAPSSKSWMINACKSSNIEYRCGKHMVNK